MTFTYGWCQFCPFFTYHDLRHGACGDCWARWAEFPDTMPPSIRLAVEAEQRTEGNKT